MARPPADWASLPADVHLAVQRHLSLEERCRCLCVCHAWCGTGAGLPELWECVEMDFRSKIQCTEPLLRWLGAWCATPERALLRLVLNSDVVITPGLAAGLVAVLRSSSASLQHLGLVFEESLWDLLVRGERAQESGFLAAIAGLQQLTSLDIAGGYVGLPPSTVLPTSLQRLVYECGELPRQVTQLTRLEHLTLDAPLPASLALPPSLRGLEVYCCEVPAQLAQLTRLEELDLHGREAVCETDQHVTALARLTRLTSLRLDETDFSALPPSWTVLGSLRTLVLDDPGPLDAKGALQPLGSWTQLTSLHIASYFNNMECMPGSLEQQLTRLSSLQHLRTAYVSGIELPPGRWQGQLTSLECSLLHVLPTDGSASSAAAVLAHATAVRWVQALSFGSGCNPTQPQLRALLESLAALPALECVALPSELRRVVQGAHTALGSPLGARLRFEESPTLFA